MAQSLSTLRDRIRTSIHGRRLGLDGNQAIIGGEDALVGPVDVRRVIQDLTSASSVGTVVNNHGVVVARISGSMTTANADYYLSNPVPGVEVTLCYANTSFAATAGSTGVAFQRPTTAFYIESSMKSTGVAVLLAQGACAKLMGISTDAYMLMPGSIGATVTGTS